MSEKFINSAGLAVIWAKVKTLVASEKTRAVGAESSIRSAIPAEATEAEIDTAIA